MGIFHPQKSIRTEIEKSSTYNCLFLEYKYFYVFLEVQNISLKELLCLDIQFAKLPLYIDEDLDLSWMK